MRLVSSLKLVRLKWMIIALGLSLNIATIILNCIFSMLFRDFRTRGLISIPTVPIVALTEFFHAGVVADVHLLPLSWHLISSLWKSIHGITNIDYPSNSTCTCKKPRGNNIFCRLLQGLWLHTKRGKMKQILLAYGLAKETVAGIMMLYEKTRK